MISVPGAATERAEAAIDSVMDAVVLTLTTSSRIAAPSVLIEQCDGRRGVLAPDRELLELDDVVELGAHRDVGDALEDDLHDDRHAVLGHEPLGLRERLGDRAGLGHPDRLAAQALGDPDVVDAVAAGLG